MCIAIVQIEGSVISKERLKRCYEANDDGCGFAYAKDGKAIIFKSMDFEEFYQEYAVAVAENMESKFLIHFRIGTQGTEDVDNCHPFRISDEMVFIHNGVIPKMPKCDTHSDTWYFNRDIMQNLPDGWLYSDAIHWLLEQSIGWSKLCVLNAPTNEVLIINESAGYWEEDGNWYSNKSYMPKIVTPVVPMTPRKGYKYAGKQSSYYDYNDPNVREWYVGTQRRRYINRQLQAFDYDRMIWRPIDSIGCYIDTQPLLPYVADSESIPPTEKMDECECCNGKFSRETMYLARFNGDPINEVFWMCETCKEQMRKYIDSGSVHIIAEDIELHELESEVF